MLNTNVGSIERQADMDWVRTALKATGHAIYGPYERLPAGRYIVEFTMALAHVSTKADNVLCAFVEAVANSGNDIVSYEPVFAAQLENGPAVVKLGFELSAPAEMEYRVFVNGTVPLLIADNARAYSAGDERLDPAVPHSAFMIEHMPMVKRVYDMGTAIALVDGELVMEKAGVRFNARSYDDVNFVHEIFVLGAYNLLLARPTCIVDVGLNVALASLVFATKPFVEEIHAFEPFDATRTRALANIGLNPELAGKIRVNAYGLGDQDGDLTLRIYDSGDSGAMSTRDSEYGTPMQIPMRDTGNALRPIIAAARARDLEVIVKVDCEGSEFPVFESLARSGLLSEIRGFMVEWHRVFEGRTQDELIAPLLAHGYVVFDISPPAGNGFFYAVRM